MRIDKDMLVIDSRAFIHHEHDKRRRRKSRRLLRAGVCLLLLLGSIMLSISGYWLLTSRYPQDIALAHEGARNLEAGVALLEAVPQDPFNATAIHQAQDDFTAAAAIFTRLHNDLPDALTWFPDPRLHAAKYLVPLALAVSQAGLAGCDILTILDARLQKSVRQPQGLTVADVIVLNHDLEQISQALTSATRQVQQLQPEDLRLDNHIDGLVSSFKSHLSLLQQGLNQAETLFSAAPLLLGIGQPANYLVEVLDSTELRPGGGFIGNYGIATFAGGRLAAAQIIDTYLLDNKLAHLPYPPAYSWFKLSRKWGLRDSNLDADFPTSARNGMAIYQQAEGKQALTGVIAITPMLIEHIISLTGPIAVPEYHEVITAQNLIDRIHYHQLIEEGQSGDVPTVDNNSSARKHFTALLANHFITAVHALSNGALPRLWQVVIEAIHTKDLQLYCSSSEAEKALQFYNIDDSIQSSARDSLFAVDANITPNKANKYLTTILHDQVTLDQAGNAIHHAVLQFVWSKSPGQAINFFGPMRYSDYLRLYLPPDSAFSARPVWLEQDHGSAFGRSFWGGYSNVNYPNIWSVALTWTVANAARPTGEGGWHYLYLIQRQAGAQQQVDVQIQLPACAAISSTATGMVQSGAHTLRLTQVLHQDTAVNIGYTCQ